MIGTFAIVDSFIIINNIIDKFIILQSDISIKEDSRGKFICLFHFYIRCAFCYSFHYIFLCLLMNEE